MLNKTHNLSTLLIRLRKIRLLLVCILVMVYAFPPTMPVPTARAAGVIYVNHAASGSDDGSSWENAYNDLQAALTEAGIGDEIWVAQGTYYPTDGADRTISFSLKDGVAIYGGFNATETERSQRDWENNSTVLSGDIGVKEDTSDNSYHVIYNDGVADTAILVSWTFPFRLAVL